ncbi:fidgetin-like protein 1 [Microdochium nivale]|nr:fidgetin-like protein 1 [Microdochium nivale]
MWPSSGISSLQKAYDESYLKCSTAVYYESQGDENEAMQSWRGALAQLRQNPLARRIDTYTPKSATESALVDSIKQLEVQCKERIDLLEALRLSRQDDMIPFVGVPDHVFESQGSSQNASPTPTSAIERGWLGDGTIPALSYTDLSKPPPLPHRPAFSARASSENTITNGQSPGSRDKHVSHTPSRPSLPRYGTSTKTVPIPNSKAERSQSPEKHTMRTTLRSGKPDKGSSIITKPRSSATTKKPGASMAATLAWTGRDTRESKLEGPNQDQIPLQARSPEQRRSREIPRVKAVNKRSQWDSHSRRLRESTASTSVSASRSSPEPVRDSGEFSHTKSSTLALGAASNALNSLNLQDRYDSSSNLRGDKNSLSRKGAAAAHENGSRITSSGTEARMDQIKRKPPTKTSRSEPNSTKKQDAKCRTSQEWKDMLESTDEDLSTLTTPRRPHKPQQQTSQESPEEEEAFTQTSEDEETRKTKREWQKRKTAILRNLPPGVDESAAQAIFNEIVVQGDEVHWSDVAGLEIAKTALREAVVYPFLRPDLFMGLREPARGMLLFGPPGTGKTMLARAVATESKSTFFSISASSLTSKYLGESEKLVRALFGLARAMAPSIIFVDEIDSLLSQRSGSGEHEATRRIKTEFLIQWSDLQRAAAGKETPGANKDRGDPNRVLVLAATNLPWAIDEAARRRFVRRQYIPLPEAETRSVQLKTLLGQQNHNLSDDDITDLVMLTDGFSGSDITALAKDAAMGPLRSLGEALLHMTMDEIRPISFDDFRASLRMIRPSVNKEGLKEYEDWAKQFGERGG